MSGTLFLAMILSILIYAIFFDKYEPYDKSKYVKKAPKSKSKDAEALFFLNMFKK